MHTMALSQYLDIEQVRCCCYVLGWLVDSALCATKYLMDYVGVLLIVDFAIRCTGQPALGSGSDPDSVLGSGSGSGSGLSVNSAVTMWQGVNCPVTPSMHPAVSES